MQMLLALALIVLTPAAPASPALRDIDGGVHRPFAAADHPSVLLFVTSDCPISNAYAPELQRICAASAGRGVRCLLLYEDDRLTAAAVRTHLEAYRSAGVAAAIDSDRAIARRAGASVTPEAVVVDRAGGIRYRGRVDNLYVDLGRRRHAASVHDLRDAIDAVLSDRPVATPRTAAFGCYISPRRDRSEASR
jgi:thiol-disulfide isomerase/thioredoxin